MSDKHKVAGLIVAGGSGKRMGADMPKQYIDIGGETILEKTIKSFYLNRSCIQIFVSYYIKMLTRYY